MNENAAQTPAAINWRLAPLSLVIFAAGFYVAFQLQQRGALQERVSIRWEDAPVIRPDVSPSPAVAVRSGAAEPTAQSADPPSDGASVAADRSSAAVNATTATGGGTQTTASPANPSPGDPSSGDGAPGARLVGGRADQKESAVSTENVANPVYESATIARSERVVLPKGLEVDHDSDRHVRKTNHDTLMSSWNTLSRELADAVDGSAGDRVRELVAAGADINASDIRGETPLIKAAWNSDAAMVRTLLELGADVFLATNDGRTALYTGVVSGNPEVVTLLLEADAPPNAITDFGKTPLMASAWIDHPDIAVQLLHYGAEPNQQDTRGRGALFYALWDSNIDVARILAANGARLDQSDYLGQTAADIARLRRIDLDDVTRINSRVN